MFKSYSVALSFLAILLIAGCAQKQSTQIADSNLVVIESVPFIKQKDKFCGPAAMASVMQHYGQDIDQDEIGQAIYIPELNGALISDMENFAKEKGYTTESSNGNLDALKSSIDNSRPVILLVDRGKWKVSVPHYYVAYGYNDQKETVLLHTGFESEQEISFEKLEGEWGKMNRLMLVLKK